MIIQCFSDQQLTQSKSVLSDHIVDPFSRESAFESGLWCICSQATTYEMASQFIYRLRRSSSHNSQFKVSDYSVLTNVDLVDKVSADVGWRFANMGRFKEFIKYFSGFNESDFLKLKFADNALREEIVSNVPYLGRKTFSFWNLCLGGTNLLALDVYVMRGLHNLGLNINPDYFTPKSRSNESQKVRKTPGKIDYINIENSARKIFSNDERFLLENNQTNMALVDSVLWWAGANRNSFFQGNLFGESSAWLILPYAEKLR